MESRDIDWPKIDKSSLADPTRGFALPTPDEFSRNFYNNVLGRVLAREGLSVNMPAISYREPDRIADELRSGSIVRIDLTGLPASKPSDCPEAEQAFFKIALSIEKIADSLYVETDTTFSQINVDFCHDVKELLKNAFAHGNKADTALPIYIRMRYDESSLDVEIFDTASSDDENSLSRQGARKANIYGFGQGESSIDPGSYSRKPLLDDAGQVVGSILLLRTGAPSKVFSGQLDPEVALPQDGKLRLRHRTSKDGSVSLVIDAPKPPLAEMRVSSKGADNVKAPTAADGEDMMGSGGRYKDPDSDSIIEEVPAMEQDLDNAYISSAIKVGLSMLTAREEFVLRALYGIFEDGFPEEYAERMEEELISRIRIPDNYLFSVEFLGDLINVTRGRVMQIAENALRKLKRHLSTLAKKEETPHAKIQRSRTMKDAEQNKKDEYKITELIQNGQIKISSEDGTVLVAKLTRQFLKYSRAFTVSLHDESDAGIASIKVIDGKVPRDGVRGADNIRIGTTLMGIAMRVARRDGYGLFNVLGISSDAFRDLLISLGFESVLPSRGKIFYSFNIQDKPLPLFGKPRSSAGESQSIASLDTPVRFTATDEK
ncbi:MAG TPA: hypothetical protein PLV52_05600, partial [Candidatus Omnitrophota bacterium]|nr:hypothetical protein [Candidatus Omnitrophota bacterium]